MKKILSVALIAALGLCLTSCFGKTTFKDNEGLSKGLIDSVSNYMGIVMAIQGIPQQQFGELNYDVVHKSMLKALTDTAFLAKVNYEELNQTINDFMMKRQAYLSEKNLREGQEFLEKNKTAEGVVTLESGLQYKILEEGTGIKPQQVADTIEANYTGTFINGQKFDSSYDRGTPHVTPLTGVIAGWQEAFQLFGEGTKAILYVPSELAYGPQAANQMMIFEVELIKVYPFVPVPEKK